MTIAAIREAVTDAGKRLSIRDLAKALYIPKTTIERAIDANRGEWYATVEGPET